MTARRPEGGGPPIGDDDGALCAGYGPDPMTTMFSCEECGRTLGEHEADTMRRVSGGFLSTRQLDQISNAGQEAIGLCATCLIQAMTDAV
jgi:hypothetical protein